MQLLYYDSDSLSDVYLMTYVFLGVSFCSFFILFVGSCFHKMVGVELIQTLQMIFYMHLGLTDYSLVVSSMQSLSLVSLDTLFWQQECQSLAAYQGWQKVNFGAECA